MNEKDLMNALNDIDDELFVFEEKRRKPLKGSWKVLIAAALIMAFSVTAYAIGNITTSQKTKIYGDDDVWRLYYNTEGKDEVEYYEMNVEYQLEPQKISDEFYADAVASLNYDYECIRQTYATLGEEYVLSEGEELWASMSFFYDSSESKKIYSVEELEEYIGFELCLSDELRDGVNGIVKRYNEGRTAYRPCNITVIGKKVSEAEGNFIPISAEIHFTANYDDKGNSVHTVVYISLSEEKAIAESVWYSFEKEGKWTEKIIKTDSGREIYLLHNNPKKGYRSKARACWTEDGIGYEAYADMAFDWEFRHEGVKYLLPYIENLE